MHLPQDWKELLELFNSHKVEYLIVEAHALALHGIPRYTGDIDILVNPSEENAVRILAALRDFGFGLLSLDVADFSQPAKVVQLGVVPNRIDLLTGLTGVTFDDGPQTPFWAIWMGIPVPYIGIRAFRKNKLAAGRPRDLADLHSLLGRRRTNE